MNAHTRFEELLPLYAAGQLHGAQKAEVEAHLTTCAGCRADLELWSAVAGEVRAQDRALAAPTGLAERALVQVVARGASRGPRAASRQAWQLLRTQWHLVRSDVCITSAIIMLIGVFTALIMKQTNLIYFLSPLVAASSIAILHDPERDPAMELVLSTPTSAWKLLLARLSVTSAYNLLLALAGTLILFRLISPALLGSVILGWLGPLAFLSALALLLTLWLGTGWAVAISYGLWMGQYVPFKGIQEWSANPAWGNLQDLGQRFWHDPLLLLLLAGLLLVVALWSSRRAPLRLQAPLG